MSVEITKILNKIEIIKDGTILESSLDANFNKNIALVDSDDITEGSTNLYYTNEKVDDRVNALLVEGDNITLTYDDTANTLTIDAASGGGGQDSFLVRDVSGLFVSNSNAFNEVLSTTIPADTLTDGKIGKFKIVGAVSNNSGYTLNMVIKITLGSTEMYLDTTSTMSSDAIQPYNFSLEGEVIQDGVGSQKLGGFWHHGDSDDAQTGEGNITNTSFKSISTIRGSANEDETTDLEFKIEAALSYAFATYSLTIDYTYMEIL